MGLTQHLLYMIIQTHQQKPLQGPVLTLGRQRLHCSYEHTLKIMQTLGYTPHELPEGTPLHAHPKLGPGAEHEITDEAFFGLLGLPVVALDFSDYEGAAIVADLNRKIPKRLLGKFPTIIDSGTVEHLFDMKQAFMNIVDLLAPNGMIMHFTPVNNFVNHGFYQLCPTVFFDYYEANGFRDLEALMLVLNRFNGAYRPIYTIPYDHEKFYGGSGFYNDANSVMQIAFRATKTPTSTSNVIPIQKMYRKMYDSTFQQTPVHTLTYSDEGLEVVMS